MANEWLKTRLDSLGKTQTGLAQKLGMDPPRISEIIKGKRKIQSGEIEGFAEYLNLSREQILAMIENPDLDIRDITGTEFSRSGGTHNTGGAAMSTPFESIALKMLRKMPAETLHRVLDQIIDERAEELGHYHPQRQA